MKIEVADLKKGDEIIVSSGGTLKYLKLLRDPRLGKKIGYWSQKPLYVGTLCSARREEIVYTNTYTKRIWKKKRFICTDKDHNIQIYQNLNERDIWLVKREDI